MPAHVPPRGRPSARGPHRSSPSGRRRDFVGSRSGGIRCGRPGTPPSGAATTAVPSLRNDRRGTRQERGVAGGRGTGMGGPHRCPDRAAGGRMPVGIGTFPVYPYSAVLLRDPPGAGMAEVDAVLGVATSCSSPVRRSPRRPPSGSGRSVDGPRAVVELWRRRAVPARSPWHLVHPATTGQRPGLRSAGDVAGDLGIALGPVAGALLMHEPGRLFAMTTAPAGQAQGGRRRRQRDHRLHSVGDLHAGVARAHDSTGPPGSRAGLRWSAACGRRLFGGRSPGHGGPLERPGRHHHGPRGERHLVGDRLAGAAPGAPQPPHALPIRTRRAKCRAQAARWSAGARKGGRTGRARPVRRR